MKRLLIVLAILGIVALFVLTRERGDVEPSVDTEKVASEKPEELEYPETFAELQAMVEDVEQPLRKPDDAQRARMESILGQPVRPANIIPIPDISSRHSVGDTITIEAKVMGSLTPFASKEASFTVGDEMTIASCDLISGEVCTTPWDVHQEVPDAVEQGTAVIHLTEANGKLINASAKHVAGLKELRRLRIAGKLIELQPGAYPVIQASAIQFLD